MIKKCGKKCHPCGSAEIYAEQVPMPLNGRVRYIDPCIAPIVAALNGSNIPTYACCCGHGVQDGSIFLEDGRELLIRKYEGVIV